MLGHTRQGVDVNTSEVTQSSTWEYFIHSRQRQYACSIVQCTHAQRIGRPSRGYLSSRRRTRHRSHQSITIHQRKYFAQALSHGCVDESIEHATLYVSQCICVHSPLCIECTHMRFRLTSGVQRHTPDTDLCAASPATTGKSDPLIPAERVLMPQSYSVSRNLRLAECPLLGVCAAYSLM